MKFLMLCREPRLYSCESIKRACEKRQVALDILDPNRFVMMLDHKKMTLYYQMGEVFEKKKTALQQVAGYDAVIPRFGTGSTEIGCNVLRSFEQQGIASLNSASAFTLARDKWQSLQTLASQQIPIPNTMLNGELADLSNSLEKIGVPTVIKTLSGSQGVGVMLAEKKAVAVSMLETLKQANVPHLLQQFITESQGSDIRAFVIGHQVVAAMERAGQIGEFRANIHRGGSAKSIKLTREEQDLAIKATQAMGLDVAGVDLIRSNNGLMVLEVNASPGLEMIEKVSQVDIAALMIDHLLEKLQKNS